MTPITLAMIAALPYSALGQAPTSAHTDWQWQVRLPGESDWRSGIVEVPADVGPIQVRAFCSTSPEDSSLRWGSAQMDAVVRDASDGDWIDSVGIGDFLAGTPAAVTRIGSSLKLDRAGDLLPPGEGASWYFVGHSISQLGLPPASLTVFNYALHLDGTPGDRTISHVFGAVPPLYSPEQPIRLYWRPITPEDTLVRPSVSVSNAILRVVPAPGTTAILALILLAPRRRR